MKNADMPAMPNNNPDTYPVPVCSEWAYGLTKREMFAMNAPEMPEWFVSQYLDEIGYKVTHDMIGSTPTSEANMPYPHKEMYFAWRTYYANNILEELEIKV